MDKITEAIEYTSKPTDSLFSQCGMSLKAAEMLNVIGLGWAMEMYIDRDELLSCRK